MKKSRSVERHDKPADNANWIHEDLTQKKAQQFTKDVLDHMRERLSDYQEQYGDLYNLEATPAESTSYRLAKHDVEKYPGIITASESGKTRGTAKSILDGAGIRYHVIDAEENRELVRAYGVMHAPTLVVVNDGAISRYANASNIQKYSEQYC